MEPIPLRDLMVLLNYERMISDPRFFGTSLVASSLADPRLGAVGRATYNQLKPFGEITTPETIEYVQALPRNQLKIPC